MKIPKRIILSRKGFDEGAGKCSSPLVDDRLFSMPIPESPEPSQNGIRFSEISAAETWMKDRGVNNLDEAIRRLRPRARKFPKYVHLDPDIRPNLRPNGSRSAPMAFGQSGNALSELRNCCVQEDDLFLFFGRFEELERNGTWKFQGRKKHILWGWLQIGRVIDLYRDPIPEWAKYHPHVLHCTPGQKPYGTGRNVLYQAAPVLSFKEANGAGEFPRKLHYHELTSRCSSCDCDWWDLPNFFFEEGCAQNRKKKPSACNHGNKDIPECYARADYSGQGQEFVFLTRGREKEFEDWLIQVFEGVEIEA